MRRLGAHCLVVVMKRGNARGAKGVGHQRWIGSTGNGRNPIINGRRQPSLGGTSRMMREYHVRICEGLGVKFPGSTRHLLPSCPIAVGGSLSPDSCRTRRMLLTAAEGPGCVKKLWGCDAASTALVLAVPRGKIVEICSVIPGEAPGGFLRVPVRHDGADLRWSWPLAERQRRRSLSPALCCRRARSAPSLSTPYGACASGSALHPSST